MFLLPIEFSTNKKDFASLDAKAYVADSEELYFRYGKENPVNLKKRLGIDKSLATTFNLNTLIKYKHNQYKLKSPIDGHVEILSGIDILSWQLALGSDQVVVPYAGCAVDFDFLLNVDDKKHQENLNTHAAGSNNNADALSAIRRLSGQVKLFLSPQSIKHLASAIELCQAPNPFCGIALSQEVMMALNELTSQMNIPGDINIWLVNVNSANSKEQASKLKNDIRYISGNYPISLALSGDLLTNGGQLDINDEANRLDQSPIDHKCLCYACQNFTRSYFYHLYSAKEVFGHRLAMIHNLTFCLNLG